MSVHARIISKMIFSKTSLRGQNLGFKISSFLSKNIYSLYNVGIIIENLLSPISSIMVTYGINFAIAYPIRKTAIKYPH